MSNAIRRITGWAAATCLSFVVTIAHAALPATINYQGFLTNPGTGAPLSTAGTPLSVTFKLWDALTAGNLKYSETQSVTVTNGTFNVQIGTGTMQAPPGVAFSTMTFDTPYWLEVTVGTETLSPRQPLASAPYALRAASLTSDNTTFNTASGSGALASNTIGFGNTASGFNALTTNSTGSYDTANGAGALRANTIGYNNTASGYSALNGNTTGSNNTAIGAAALLSNTTANSNTAIGSSALTVQSFSNGNAPWESLNTAVGSRALYFNQPTATNNGFQNTALGANALYANQTGTNNTASGVTALYANTTGNNNTATGVAALQSNQTGSDNTALGVAALNANQTGAWNTASGSYALAVNTGSANSAFGRQSLSSNGTGANNTAIGYQSLTANTTGNNNIAVGFQSGNNITTGSYNIDIGNQGVAGDTGVARIGTVGQTTQVFMAGISGVTPAAANALGVVIDSNGQLWTRGFGSTASGQWATVSGGYSNTASATYAAVGGGYGNTASTAAATVAGGLGNTADNAPGPGGGYATVGGGYHNTATSFGSGYATVGGGSYNIAGGASTTVGGGASNTAGGNSATVGGGNSNTASGDWATVSGGAYNVAQGAYSFAGGYRAKSLPNGCFTWADSSNFDYTCTLVNAFTVRATGGVYFISSIDGAGTPNAGVQLVSGSGSWSTFSDRNSKTNFAPVDGLAVLKKLAEIPVSSWNYKAQDPSIRHLGPMAQDFRAAFGLGEDDKHISTVDEGGVALAAIQGLNAKLEISLREKDAQLRAQAEKISALEKDRLLQSARMEALEQQATRMARVLSRLDKPDMLAAARQ